MLNPETMTDEYEELTEERMSDKPWKQEEVAAMTVLACPTHRRFHPGCLECRNRNRIVVERFGGRPLDRWRVIWRGHGTPDSDHAYHHAVKAMRRGGVRIRNLETNEVLREQHAPYARRWGRG